MNNTIIDIYRSLLTGINIGETKPGEPLPPEIKLAETFGTNRMNAHRAVKMLEENGLVIRKKRTGTALCDNIDQALVARLIKEANRIVYVLYSATPHWIHWNETSFLALEKEIATANYSVMYDSIPAGGTREDYIALLKKISEAGASALVIFPDTEDSTFLQNNGDLLLDFQMPVYMLNRSGEPIPLDMVSFVAMDPFSDGINVGTMLKKCGCRNIVMFNEDTGQYFWGVKRYEGLLIGLQRGNEKKGLPENIPATPNGFAKTLELVKKHRGNMLIVAVNNHYAAKFIDFAKQQGLFIPADYRLIAFDDNPLFRSYNLTSMAVPMQKVGRLFGKLICDRSSWLEEYRGKVSIKVNSELVIRETFKPQA